MEQLVHDVTQAFDEAALGVRPPLRRLEQVGTDASRHHRRRQDEQLENKLRAELESKAEREEQGAVGDADPDGTGERVTGDREAVHGRQHDPGHRIHRERAGDSGQHENRRPGHKLLTEADRVAPALRRGPPAQRRADEANDDHRRRR